MKMKVFKKIALFLAAALMIVSLTVCSAASNDTRTPSAADSSAKVEQTKAFPKFQGVDFEGNAVDESMFGKNTVTVLNFWFNGCPACVNEMPGLEKFNQKLKEKGAELVGVNVMAGEGDDVLKEAKEILAKQGATYKNILVKDGKEINDYLNGLFGFPTTVLVDRNGNIVGEPILGCIDDEARMADILKMIEDVAANRTVSSPAGQAESNDAVNALIAEENSLFDAHIDTWTKVFDSIPHDKALQMDPAEYLALLKEKITNPKSSFTEDELKILNEDLRKIEELEQKIQALTEAK